MRNALTVEIHDVTPAFWPEISQLMQALQFAGIAHPTLLVVPCWQDPRGRQWDLRHHREFAAVLREAQRRGCELVQHGFTHRAPALPPRGLRRWVLHHLISRGEAEFAHLGEAAAVLRLAAGRHVLLASGLNAPGFVPPVWQLSPGAAQAVRAMGFAFLARLNRIDVLGHRRPTWRVSAPALTYCAPHPWVDQSKRVVMRAMVALNATAPLVRVALHPEDARARGRLDHILGQIRALRRHRLLVSYRDWLAEKERSPWVASERAA